MTNKRSQQDWNLEVKDINVALEACLQQNHISFLPCSADVVLQNITLDLEVLDCVRIGQVDACFSVVFNVDAVNVVVDFKEEVVEDLSSIIGQSKYKVVSIWC